MTCGCKDNNKLSNNKRLDGKLSLESMQNLSIDEIISLYRQGYVLEGLEPIDNLYGELYLPSLSLATCPTTAIYDK